MLKNLLKYGKTPREIEAQHIVKLVKNLKGTTNIIYCEDWISPHLPKNTVTVFYGLYRNTFHIDILYDFLLGKSVNLDNEVRLH